MDTHTFKFESKRILIAHFDDTKPKIWTKAFQEMGYEVKFTRCLDTAMEELTPHKYDAVVLGLLLLHCRYLPWESSSENDSYEGFTMAKWVRLLYPKMPILIISRGSSRLVTRWCDENPPAIFLSWAEADQELVTMEFKEILRQKYQGNDTRRTR